MRPSVLMPDDCANCRLGASRHRIVLGVGPETCAVAFVGEAPGKEEDLQGKPFVGRAGRILTETLTGLGVSRDDVFITNLVKCRPPGNRRPRQDEKRACRGFLLEEITATDAKVLCAMGQTAARDLFLAEGKMSELVGKVADVTLGGRRYTGIVTYHPAACLYRRDRLSTFQQTIERSLRIAGVL